MTNSILNDSEVKNLKLLQRGRARRHDTLRNMLKQLQIGQGFLYPYSAGGRLAVYDFARKHRRKMETRQTEDRLQMFVRRLG